MSNKVCAEWDALGEKMEAEWDALGEKMEAEWDAISNDKAKRESNDEVKKAPLDRSGGEGKK